jgi:hypothetical protein
MNAIPASVARTSAAATAASTVSPVWRTVAPYERVASVLEMDAPSGT